MKYFEEFNNVMKEQTEIALATSVNDIPNVRIVNFYYNPKKKGVLYLATFKHNAKVKEFMQNSKVSFTTIPTNDKKHVRVQQGNIKKSDNTIFDLKEAFVSKMPNYNYIISEFGEKLELFEVHFSEVTVTVDLKNIEKIVL